MDSLSCKYVEFAFFSLSNTATIECVIFLAKKIAFDSRTGIGFLRRALWQNVLRKFDCLHAQVRLVLTVVC